MKSVTLLLIGLLAAALSFTAYSTEAAHDPSRPLIEATRKLIQQGKVVDALRNLAILEKQSANNPEARFAIGEIFQELGALRAAQLQRVAPESAAAHELLGQSFESQGKLEDALAEYRRAVEKNPAAPGLHFLIGNVDWKLKEADAAQAELKQELKLNPHHAMANLRMGQIVLETQRDEPLRAVVFLREAATDARSSLEAHRELGKALRLAHKFPEAVHELQLVASQRPNDDSVHAQLAALYKDLGDRERARQEIAIHARILSERSQASQKLRASHPPQF